MSEFGSEMSFDGSPEDPGGGKPPYVPPETGKSSRRPSTGEIGTGTIKKPRLIVGTNVQNDNNGKIIISNQFDTLNSDANEHEIINNDTINKNKYISDKKMPPLTVTDVSLSKLIEVMKSYDSPVRKSDIRYRMTHDGIKILTNDVMEFKATRDLLKCKKMKFFSHPLDEEKTVKYVIYGLYDIKFDELKEILRESDVFPDNISKLQINKKRYDDQNIFLLQFKYDQNMSLEKLRTIRHVNGVFVRFKKYVRNQVGVTQCSNCLKFSHGARNCFLPPRCIRCGESHASGMCDKLISPKDPKSKIPASQVKCANCGGRHTANYEKCPERQKYLASRQAFSSSLHKKLQGQKQRRTEYQNYYKQQLAGRNTNPNFRFQGQSYANVTSSPSNDLFSPTQLYQIFKKFINELQRCKSRQQQIDTIAQMTFECMSNDCP